MTGHFFKICCALAALVLITACSPVYKTDYRFSAPPTEQGKQCANNCLDKLDNCLASCRTAETQCRHMKNLEAGVEYLIYMNNQKEQGLPVERDKDDFANYSACNNGCAEQCNYQQRICHVNCGGDIAEHTYCAANCD